MADRPSGKDAPSAKRTCGNDAVAGVLNIIEREAALYRAIEKNAIPPLNGSYVLEALAAKIRATLSR